MLKGRHGLATQKSVSTVYRRIDHCLKAPKKALILLYRATRRELLPRICMKK
jgi:hypothetical protein